MSGGGERRSRLKVMVDFLKRLLGGNRRLLEIRTRTSWRR